MSRKDPIKTPYIILKKTPYMESSVIVSGLSPELGKIDLLIKGDRRISGKKSPAADLFRVIDVQYYERTSSIFTPILFEVIKDYDSIGSMPDKLFELHETAKFVLRSSHYQIRCPNLFKALLKHIERTVAGEFTESFFIRMVYLYENGFLKLSKSGALSESEIRAIKVISIMIDYAVGKRERIGLNLTESYLKELDEYFNRMLREADIVF